MPLKADQIFALFPNPVLTPILGEPDHASIRVLQKQTNKNLSAIPSNLGGGLKGLVSLATSAEVYLTISGVAFIPPSNPGTGPTTQDINNAKTAKEVTLLHSSFALRLALYEEYMAADRLPVKLLTAAVNDIFTTALSDEHTGYAGVTTRNFFKHLTDEYCDIDEAALTVAAS